MRCIAIFCCLSLLPALAMAGTQELVQDPQFSRGVKVIPPLRAPHWQQPSPTIVCLPDRDCASAPVWQLQQWYTATDIAKAESTADGWVARAPDGTLQKRVQWLPGDGVVLEIDGLAEAVASSADGVPRYLPDLGKPWPHWLVSQSLPSVRLSTVRQLLLHGRFRMLQDEPNYREGRDPAVHAARLVLALTVRNRLTGNYFWVTLPLYDDRFAFTGFGCQKCVADGERCYVPAALGDPGRWRCPGDRVGERWWQNEKPGTARMIFRLPSNDFMQVPASTGQWVSVEGDLMPYLREGVEAVRQWDGGGHFPQDLFFYEPGLLVIGWEITGFNHVAVELDGWQLTANE